MFAVAMGESCQRLIIGQSQPTLRAFESLNRRHFVHVQCDAVFRRLEGQPDDLGRLGGKLGIGANGPTPTTLQRDYGG